MSNVSCDTKSQYEEKIQSEDAFMFGPGRLTSKPERFFAASQKRLWTLLQMVMIGGLMFAMCMKTTHDFLISFGFPIILFTLCALIALGKFSSSNRSLEASSLKESTEQMRSLGVRP